MGPVTQRTDKHIERRDVLLAGMCGVDVAQIGVDLTPAQTAQSVSVTHHTQAQQPSAPGSVLGV